MLPGLAVAGPRALHAVGACDNFHFKTSVMTRFRASYYLHGVPPVEPATEHFGIAEVLAPGIL